MLNFQQIYLIGRTSNPNESSRRSAAQWDFPLQSKCLVSVNATIFWSTKSFAVLIPGSDIRRSGYLRNTKFWSFRDSVSPPCQSSNFRSKFFQSEILRRARRERGWRWRRTWWRRWRAYPSRLWSSMTWLWWLRLTCENDTEVVSHIFNKWILLVLPYLQQTAWMHD